jgi:hypothetical protein
MMPRTYHVESKILAQRNQVIAALGNPNRTVPRDADAPTRAASETVLRRDNLISLIKQTGLIDQWTATRAPAHRLKDWAMALVRGEPTEEDRLDALVGLLEKWLRVTTGEGTVTIQIEWPNDEMAFRLVEAAQQNFLEARHVSEISTISEAISILEGHAAGLRDTIDGALERIQRFKDNKAIKPPSAPKSGARIQAEREREQVAVMLASKRRAISDLEEFRQKRLSELQAKLAELKAIYADAHPEVVHTQQSIDALAQDSVQLAELKNDEEGLQHDLSRLDQGLKESQASAAADAPRAPQAEGARQAPDPEKEAQAVEFAKARMNVSLAKYDELLERIDSAKIELATARAAFKYRYSIIRPAQRPKKAEKPNVPMVMLAGVIAAFFMAVFAAVLADIRSGRVLESWQVKRVLELPLLAEVSKP